MTRTEMLARCRTLLDEATAAFWTDAEVYSALADAQQAVANYFLSIHKIELLSNPKAPIPQPLESLYAVDTNTTATGLVSLPADYWHLLAASFAYTGGLAGTFYVCRIYRLGETMFRDVNNSFFAGTTTDPIVYEVYSSGRKFYFLPAVSGTGGYALNYLKIPTAISSSVDPTLPVQTHNAIVFYAVAQMLFKDQRPQEAQLQLQNAFNELRGI